MNRLIKSMKSLTNFYYLTKKQEKVTRTDFEKVRLPEFWQMTFFFETTEFASGI